MRWGIVSTIKATTEATLEFVAHHLDLGAERIFVYLDARDDRAQDLLAAHPRISVTRTDRTYWTADGRNRPGKHQVRQGRNANHAYARAGDLDWLIHMDVDEFLWPRTSVADTLSRQPADTLVGRVRPIEAMVTPDADPDTGATYFKGFVPARGRRQEISERLFPTFGKYVRGGFLSHVQGKVFVRTGLSGLELRIHHAFRDGRELSDFAELGDIDLCHVHVTDWQGWLSHYRYRHDKGSYRPDLKPAIPAQQGGLSLHDLFAILEDQEGEAGLRAFFDEVCVASPALRAALANENLLRTRRLDLAAKRQRHFPDFSPSVAD